LAEEWVQKCKLEKLPAADRLSQEVPLVISKFLLLEPFVLFFTPERKRINFSEQFDLVLQTCERLIHVDPRIEYGSLNHRQSTSVLTLTTLNVLLGKLELYEKICNQERLSFKIQVRLKLEVTIFQLLQLQTL
jgi:hypothetical protein